MTRNWIGAFVAVSLAVPAPGYAQFGGLLGSLKNSSSSSTNNSLQQQASAGCDTPKKQKNAAIMGAIGKVAGSAISRASALRYVPIAEFTAVLSTAIACRLDQKEQKQAADATDTALRSEKVGATTSWQSGSRKDVTGTSTVTAMAPAQGKAKCMIVTDVVIVDGEETRAEKKMCKAPGQNRYTIAQV